ncbi:MAG: hypothetical protein K5873_02870 [Treponema sp.]|nr:hypothetical protein [Treponema sp.]
MKKCLVKKIGLVLTASALVFASCSSDSDDSGANTNATIENSSSQAPESASGSEAENNSSNSGNSGNENQNTENVSTDTATGVMDTPTAADVSNASVEIVKSEGWLNSAYVIFKQVEGATYKVLCDDVEIDQELIRFYDTYKYYETSEDANLKVSYNEKTLSKVVRADVLGLAAGSHTIKVCAVGTENTSEYSSATMTVVDHDRSGFAFTGITTPGAYNSDGTLKDGAVVIYLTQTNKNSVTATIGGKSYTGIAEITQAVKTKNTGNTPVDIRVIGTVKASGNDLSCSDMSSAYALGVKEASYVTIEGVGHDATLYAAGVAAFKSEYIEIANLGLMKWGGGKDGDGISLKEDSYAWVHNCEFFYGDAGSDADQAKGDGSMDMKDDSNHVTISYNHFWDSGKMSLCGMKSETGPNYITYHHNWFDHSDSRHPRIRTMTVHVYNNYFDGNSKYGVGVTTGASCFVEGNFFRNAHDPMMSSLQGTDGQGDGTFSGENGGIIKAYNNTFEQNNTNGVKFQFITNKYDYTNDTAVSEPTTVTETLGTDNGDGTYTIYDAAMTENADESVTDGIAACGLISVSNASNKGKYYQLGKEKTGFTISVPANTSKIIVRAKCGTSGASGNAEMLKVNGKAVSMDLAADYTDYEASVSLTSDSTIEIANASSKYSMNVKEIKVIAASTWSTTYTTGISLSDIDAYEVDNRSDQVPATVVTKVGGTAYSNFDTTMGDSGLGIKIAPTDPDQAKTNVMKYSGRHESDFAFNFDNSTDDASYDLNSELNSALLAYTTSLTAIQGTSSSSGSSGNSEAGSGSSDSGSSESSSGSGTGDSGTPAASATAASVGTTWTADLSIPSWITGLSGSASTSSSYNAFGLGSTGYFSIAKNASISFTPDSACIVKVYIAGNNNTAGKGTVTASVGSAQINSSYSLPSRKDASATPFEFTVSEGDKLVTITTSYASLLYKIEILSAN